jgi:hypothetical protein
MKSVFTDKEITPTTKDLNDALATTASLWHDLESFTKSKFPGATADWKFSGDKFGWSYRISDSKRVILYLLPRHGFFKVALVFGQKATDQIMASDIAQEIKEELSTAKAYAEGRGIRIAVADAVKITDIKKLIEIKISH